MPNTTADLFGAGFDLVLLIAAAAASMCMIAAVVIAAISPPRGDDAPLAARARDVARRRSRHAARLFWPAWYVAAIGETLNAVFVDRAAGPGSIAVAALGCILILFVVVRVEAEREHA